MQPQDASRTEPDQLSLWRGLAPPRVVLSILVTVLLLIDPKASALPADVRVGLGLMAAISLTLSLRPRWGSGRRGLVIRISLDTILAMTLLLVADPRATPLMWVALLVPVMGAATLSPLFAAATWAAVSIMYTTMRIVTPDAADATFTVGLQQLLAVGLIGIPLAHWSFEAGTRLKNASYDKIVAHQQIWRLRNVGDAIRQLGMAKQWDEIDELLVGCGPTINAARVELWALDRRRPRLVAATGLPLSQSSDLLLDPIQGDPGTRTRVQTGAKTTAAGFALVVGAELPARKDSALRLWFNKTELAPEHLEVIELLVEAANQAYGTATQVQRLTAWSEELNYKATHDELTGLANRAGLQLAVADLPQPNVLYLDLDGFKPVNDNYGHHIGDLTLQAVAARFKGCLPDDATLARFGGDEFVVVIGSTSEPKLFALRSRLEESLDEPISVGGHNITLGVSVGVAAYDRDDEFDDLLSTADKDMYRRKVASNS